MRNRAKLEQSIRKLQTRELEDELEYYLDEGYDLVEAFLRVEELADEGRLTNRLRTVTRKILIDAGYFREVSDDELSRIQVSHGRKYDFKLGGKKHISVDSMFSWIEESHTGPFEKQVEQIVDEGHGMVGTPEYNTWRGMKMRCNNKNHAYYPDYGGRGITFHKRWADFNEFYKDMGKRPKGHTLDRIHVNKGYGPGNCVWADITTQNRNRRNVTMEDMGPFEQAVESSIHENIDEVRGSSLVLALETGVIKKLKTLPGTAPIAAQLVTSLSAVKDSMKQYMNATGANAFNAFFSAIKGHFNAGFPPLAAMQRKYKLKTDFGGNFEPL